MENESQSGQRGESAGAEFLVQAESMRLEGAHQDALLLLLKGLSESPSNHPARLLLARVFFELECAPFALREVGQLISVFPDNQSLRKLYQAMGGVTPVTTSTAAESVIAESEIDFDAIDDLENESK